MINHILFLPHGMQIIPGVEDTQAEPFLYLHQAMEEVIEQVEWDGDQVILLTPHGYNLEEDLVIYNHKQFQGSIFKLEDSVVYGEAISQLEITGNTELNQKILQQTSELPIKVLTHGYPDYPMTLNWGEVVPLLYLQPLGKKRHSILCYPRTRHSDLDQVIAYNTKLAKFLQDLDENVLLVISGDLSHTHQEDGPYGYHQISKPFDSMVNNWAQAGEDAQMDELLDMQPNALACGMAGMNLIHQLRKLGNYELVASRYAVPTYFGMGIYYWKAN